jgi:5-methylthioadenosine/S-adenosylhomocysteine deaminase
LDQGLRQGLLSLLRSNGYSVLDSGVYAQTLGPRFETPAEIRSLAIQGGDIVGMTCAHEATLCRELGLPYAVLCIIDNMANGIAGTEISYEEFHAGVKRNLSTMENILGLVLQRFTPAIDVNGAVGASNKIVVDSLVHARWIVPILPAEVYENHSIAVKDGRIVALLPTVEARTKYSAVHEEEFPDSVILPGFVNAHSHLGMSLMRGYADDHCLTDWLTKHIWPGEAVFVSESFVRDSAELGLAEMLRGGTTTTNDMYWFPEALTALVDKVGTRAVIGIVSIDFPSAYASGFDEYISKGLTLYEKNKHHPRISFSMAPHAPYTVADAHLAKCKKLAEEVLLRNPALAVKGAASDVKLLTAPARVHIHVHETASEVNDSATLTPSIACHRSAHRMRPLQNLDENLHLLNESLVAVHMTQLQDNEIARVAATKSNVVHCPTSNLKLASGVCPLAALTAAKVNVALGTDSTASNNGLDMFSELKLAAILAKNHANNASVIPAYEALCMATINGARALGLEQQIGSLEVGKAADFISLRVDSLEAIPFFSLFSHLVYSASRSHVTDVWVDGKRLMRDRRLLTLDEEGIKQRAKKWQEIMSKEKFEQAAKAAAAATIQAATSAADVSPAAAAAVAEGKENGNGVAGKKRAGTDDSEQPNKK